MAAMAKIVFSTLVFTAWSSITVRFLRLNAKRYFYEWISPEAFYFSQV